MDINSSNSRNLFSTLNQYENRTLPDNLPYSQDTVSISHRASTLNHISQTYFSGTIQSSDIPALSQALYEGGFLSDDEYISLGGAIDEQGISVTSQANHFLNRYLTSGEDISEEDRSQLSNVIDVINNMDQSPDEQQRLKEQQALDFMADYKDRLATDDSDILAGIGLVYDVVLGLEQVRIGDLDAASIAAYESVQDAT